MFLHWHWHWKKGMIVLFSVTQVKVRDRILLLQAALTLPHSFSTCKLRRCFFVCMHNRSTLRRRLQFRDGL